MKRDFADFWNLMWEAGLALCAAFALLNAFAPDEWLPWKPLDLSHPIGPTTGGKVEAFAVAPATSPEAAQGQTAECLALLHQAGVGAEPVADIDDGGFCVARGLVRITGGDVTPLSGGAVMQCPLAVRYVLWDRQVLRPAAREAFGVGVSRVDGMGVYSCRRIYGSTNAADRPSEHARANAIDVGGVTLADGRRVRVLDDWGGTGPTGAEGGSFLRRLRDGACRVFSTVLTPDYNEAHRDHLHLDGAPRGLCVTGRSRAP